MEFHNGVLQVSSFFAITLGIVVLFIGKRVNAAVGFLREFSIPEPVTGGLLVSLALCLVYAVADVSVTFDLDSRDFLLVYFFTTIGINASFRDLLAGGKALAILLGITLVYMVVQNIVGISVATMFGQPGELGLLGGSISLIGGHGTAIAWAPTFVDRHSIENALEIGISCATFGLILASLMGGPIATWLITRYSLQPEQTQPLDVGVAPTEECQVRIEPDDILDAVLALHICIVIGVLINSLVERLGVELPLFVTCLLAGMLVSNLMPQSYPRLSGKSWPSRGPAMGLIAEISLGTFLAMSLMSMQLWVLVDLAGPLVAILTAQFLVAVAMNVLFVFRALGKTYDAAVVTAGFGGISLGSTPTAMANMSAVTGRFGASNLAFLIVPLVCAFFIHLFNALLIPFFLARV